MQATQAHMQDMIKKEEEKKVTVISFDQKLPQVKQIGTSLDNIQKHVMRERFNIYPQQAESGLNNTKKRLYELLQELSLNGLAFIADNLSVTADLSKPKPEPRPDNAVMDVCLLVQDMPPTVFTLINDNAVSLDEVKTYNLTLAQGVIKAVRRLTTEQFSVVYGLVQMKDLNSQELFQKRLHDLHEQSPKFYVQDSLKMYEDKCKNIIHAFLSVIALSYSVQTEGNSDTLWFLTLEQFCILTENIDKREVIVRTAPSSGGKVLMREVARRLERSGPTALVMKSEEEIQVARGQKTCSWMLTLREWNDRLSEGESVKGITNIVTNCKEFSPVPEIKGRYWSFSQENQVVKLTTKHSTGSEMHGSEEDQPQDVSFPIQNLSERKMMEINKQLLFEIENKDAKIRDLVNENNTLKQSKGDINRWFDTISLGGQSADSGHFSDMSSMRFPSTLSLGPQEATGGQTETKGVIDSIKKILPSRKSKTKAWKEIPVYMYVLYNDDKTVAITLQCREQEMDRERVNTEYSHITTDGVLVNYTLKHRGQQGSRRFKEYWGTCGTYHIVLPSSPSSLIPQYWETETYITVNKTCVWNIFEVGVVEENNLDSGVWAFSTPRSWCVLVGHCTTHQTQCLQVWNDNKHVSCEGDTQLGTQGSSTRLKFGFVVDAIGGRLGFVNVDKGVVLKKMNVEFKQTVIPVFGVWPDPDDGTVEMRLISGGSIMMTEDKQRLIYNCLT